MLEQLQTVHLNDEMDNPIDMFRKGFRSIHRSDMFLPAIVLFETFFLYVFGTVLIFGIPVGIILSSRYIGFWMWGVELLYAALMLSIIYLIRKRRVMRNLRLVIGDELFFKTYPNEYKRELKRIRRRERTAERRNFDRKA